MTIIFLIIVFIYLSFVFYTDYIAYRANKCLNEPYQKRAATTKGVKKEIQGKLDNIIYATKIASDMKLTFVGDLDKLGKRQHKEGDVASKDGKLYLYKDGKWYEIIDDMPRIDYIIR